MGTFLTSQQIGSRIKILRKRKSLSQQDLGKILGISRSAITQIELGNRNLSVIEVMKLSDILGISLDDLLSTEYEYAEELELVEESEPDYKEARVSVPELSIMKFETVLLYILERCGAKPNVGETVLAKLLYFCDFNYYEVYEEHLTGAKYHKLPFGPVPQNMDTVLRRMVDHGKLQQIKSEYYGYPQVRYLPLEKPDLKKMNAGEKEIIDQVIGQYSNWTAAAISDYSHLDMPWKATESGEYIDYELSFYREPPFSVRTYQGETEQA